MQASDTYAPGPTEKEAQVRLTPFYTHPDDESVIRLSLTGRLILGLLICGLSTTALFSAVFPDTRFEILSAVSLVSTGALFLFAYQVQRPLRILAKDMRRAAETEGLLRAEEGQPGELGELAAAFNWVLARITSMKVDEIDTHRNLVQAQRQLSLKKQLEDANSALEQRVSDLSLLYDVTRSLSETLALPELLFRVASLVGQRLSVSRLTLLLFPEPSDGVLEVKSTWPLNEVLHGTKVASGEGPAGRSAQSRKPVYLSDAGSERIFGERRRGAKRSVLAVPMVHKEALLGVLHLERSEVDAFDPVEVELVCALASQIAVAVQNARLHEQTVALTLTDALTGAPNRRHLENRLEMEVARANRFATQLSVLMVDIDHFKQLNDLNGHRAGDEVLQRVYQLLRNNVRKVDLVARYGGEEFTVVLPQITKYEATEVAEKLRRVIGEHPLPYGACQPLGRITISVGVANLPVDATAQEHLMDSADSALYASKRDGRDRATPYAPGMEQHPGRERGPYAAHHKHTTGETPVVQFSAKR